MNRKSLLKRNPAELGFLSQVEREYLKLKNPAKMDIISAFKSVFKEKKSRTIPRFSPRQEARFLYDFAQGIEYLNRTEIKLKSHKAKNKFKKTIESLLNQVVASPFLLADPLFQDSKILVSSEVFLKSGKRPIDLKNSFANSFVSLLLTMRNTEEIKKAEKFALKLENLSTTLQEYFVEIDTNHKEIKLTNFTLLAVYLSRFHFKEIRGTYLEVLTNSAIVIGNLPLSNTQILSRDNFTNSNKTLEKKVKSIT